MNKQLYLQLAILYFWSQHPDEYETYAEALIGYVESLKW